MGCSNICDVNITNDRSISVKENGIYHIIGSSIEITDIFIAANTKVEIIDRALDATLQIHLEQGASVNIISLKHSSSTSRYIAMIDGANIDFNLDCVTLSSEQQHVYIYSTVNHNHPGSNSSQYIKAIAGGSSSTLFEGKVYIASGADMTNAYQQNKNLLLSNEAKIDARPWLEIYADDVKCSHGSTTGMLSEDEIFYMRQRGISLNIARKLQIEGFALEIAAKISDEKLREIALGELTEVIYKL